MKQIKNIILIFIVFCFAMFFAKTIKAETTFPVGDAGISAYTRLDNTASVDLSLFADSCFTIDKL